MTREEAIKQLQVMLVGTDWLSDKTILALSKAIEALTQLPEEDTTSFGDRIDSFKIVYNTMAENPTIGWSFAIKNGEKYGSLMHLNSFQTAIDSIPLNVKQMMETMKDKINE